MYHEMFALECIVLHCVCARARVCVCGNVFKKENHLGPKKCTKQVLSF